MVASHNKSVQNISAQPCPPRPLGRWAGDAGLSAVTVWRFRKRGWITTINIAGRPYVTAAAAAEFERRATAGEFAQSPVRHCCQAGPFRHQHQREGGVMHALMLAKAHACLAILHPVLAVASRVGWFGATCWLQAYVAALETTLTNLNACRRHDTD